MSLGLWCQLGFWLLKATVRFLVGRHVVFCQGLPPLFQSLPSALLPSMRSGLLFGKPHSSLELLVLWHLPQRMWTLDFSVFCERACGEHAEGAISFLTLVS